MFCKNETFRTNFETLLKWEVFAAKRFVNECSKNLFSCYIMWVASGIKYYYCDVHISQYIFPLCQKSLKNCGCIQHQSVIWCRKKGEKFQGE